MKSKLKKSLSLILACTMIYSLILLANPIKASVALSGSSISQSTIKPCEDPPGL